MTDPTQSPVLLESGPDLPSVPAPSLNEHLFFPSLPAEPLAESSTSPQPRQVLKDRLYVGNLHPSVDEYSLLQIFSKFGKVTKLDFLFHKAGIMKGKPRGYAFIEYGSNDEALKALSTAHDKLLRGRKLVVTFAHQAPIDQVGGSSHGIMKRRNMMEIGRPTTLSMIKTGMSSRTDGTRDKIAMMEAKLRQMEATNPKPASSSDVTQPDAFASTSRSTSVLHHPSLPSKPPPPIPAHLMAHLHTPLDQRLAPASKPKKSLPTLPFSLSSQSPSQSLTLPTHIDCKTKTAPLRQLKVSRLVGVKIGKPRDKVSRAEDG